jgi:Arc/MetJ-type ribon-helix-helix transcriptional regulator
MNHYGKAMPRNGYRSLVIPESLYNKIKQHVEDSEGRYVSISEVVREAVWNFLSNNTTHA